MQKTLQGGETPNCMWGALALPTAVGSHPGLSAPQGPGTGAAKTPQPSCVGQGVGGSLCHLALLSAATTVGTGMLQPTFSFTIQQRPVEFFPPDVLGAFSLKNVSCFVN